MYLQVALLNLIVIGTILDILKFSLKAFFYRSFLLECLLQHY